MQIKNRYSRDQNKKCNFMPQLGLAVIAVLGCLGLNCTRNAEAEKTHYDFKQPPPASGIAAKIGDELIPMSVLEEGAQLELHAIETQKFTMLMDLLQQEVIKRLLGARAKEVGMSLEEYLNKKVFNSVKKPDENEIQKFIVQQRIPENQINPQVKERIALHLENEKRKESLDSVLAKMTQKQHVEVYFRAPTTDINIDIEGSPVLGEAKAPVTVVIFSDFECPYCARGAERITELKKKYASKVKFVFKHYPLPMHANAMKAAEASMCVHQQKPNSFWQYHDILFKNQNQLDVKHLEEFAQKVQVDVKTFSQCLEQGQFTQSIKDDMAKAQKIGVKSTPIFFINGQVINGAVPVQEFENRIDAILKP